MLFKDVPQTGLGMGMGMNGTPEGGEARDPDRGAPRRRACHRDGRAHHRGPGDKTNVSSYD